MIKIGEQIKIEFGTGDVRIVSSAELDGSVGYLALENQDPPRPIGKNIEQEGRDFDPGSYPILMSFTKVESVDALMGELQRVRDIMSQELVYEVIYELYATRTEGDRLVYSASIGPLVNSFDNPDLMNQWLEDIADNPAYEVSTIRTRKRKEGD